MHGRSSITPVSHTNRYLCHNEAVATKPKMLSLMTRRIRVGSRRSVYFLLLLLLLATSWYVVLIKTKEYLFISAIYQSSDSEMPITKEPFPVSVDPNTKLVTENPAVEAFFSTHIAKTPTTRTKTSWWQKTIGKLAQFGWYQNLASPISRVVVIEPGERKEQVVDNFGDILGWDTPERKIFAELIDTSLPTLSDGKYFPGQYLMTKDTRPEVAARILNDQFQSEILHRYSEELETLIPLSDTLIIASLLEREAYDFSDMRYISGVIWNRLFIDMKLQIDATLQYAKGSRERERQWWPLVRPADKYIESPHNTYQHKGLPPTPIASPSLAAVLAALNPRETDCFFYFHDADGGFHCSPTYEEHVSLLKQYYGRGK